MSQEVIYTSESTAARRRVYFQLVDSTDGITGKTGQTGVGRISKNGAATAATSGSLVEIDATNMPGRYYLELTTGEVDTIGTVILRYKGATTAEMVAQAAIVSYDPYAAPSTNAQIAGAVWDEARASHTTAGSFGQGVTSVIGDVGVTQAGADKVWATTTRALTDKSNFALSATGMDAPLDSANGVETGLSLRGAWRLICSVLVGKASGLDTATAVYRNAVADSKARVTATTTIDGNRTAVTTDAT